jgi:hypothetical protein
MIPSTMPTNNEMKCVSELSSLPIASMSPLVATTVVVVCNGVVSCASWTCQCRSPPGRIRASTFRFALCRSFRWAVRRKAADDEMLDDRRYLVAGRLLRADGVVNSDTA